ncbi:hypothetical protein MLD38_014011 [Melastoma candidum]|uniref:Uncharacterized protein n=1 Tax=Melastoma candidum TaxID=119954 RepID=A0ACB9RBC5_9MYRT|nr:hypothetical protein MLD38_014011 [Melastoma candidum]
MGWDNIYKRRMKVFAAAFIIYLDYKALQQREKWTSKSKSSVLWQRAHERNAKRVLSLIIELEGLWVKLGQYLSTRADVLPEAYISLLKQLQDSLPPRPLQEVRQTIQRELGKTLNDLFSSFIESPLATASIAQVHRATLADGTEVVVKVQHDGVKKVILEDLKNAKSVVDWIAWAEPQYNFNPMIDEWCKEAPKELDFNIEAENTRRVAKNLGCKDKKGDTTYSHTVDVLIPEVIQSTEKVLILEYMDGIRLNDFDSLERFGVAKQKIVEEITRAYAHQIYVDGFFNGDPHPGNFLVSKEVPHRPILLDFGLTKSLSIPVKQALAKMFLASVEGDHVALLSAFTEMGLKLRLDIPEQAMEVTTVFFRTTTPANEAFENVKSLAEQREKNLKVIQEKMKLDKKEVKRFNPVDAFPGDIVIFSRVLNLLRGLSSTMNARIVYHDVMRPFAEYALQGSICKTPSVNEQWVCNTPVHSAVETKLREYLVNLGNKDKILGIQVCAYKDGKVVIDTAAGLLGKYDPRPVQPDSLFPVFSVTKGITAGMLHWLVDKGKLKLEENVATLWPEFGCNGKDDIKVYHVLNHTAGLHNALAELNKENPLLLCDWEECLKRMATSTPETEPGQSQLYHYLSFGWLCGGIIEHASGKKFQEVLEEAFIYPLNIEGELYIGVPAGVESRLATLTVDRDDLSHLSQLSNRTDLPSTFQVDSILQAISTLPAMFNMLNTRRAIIPAANGHCSARALARYYAALVDGGVVPPPHSSSFSPRLGGHPHIPKFASHKDTNKQRKIRRKDMLLGKKSLYQLIPNQIKDSRDSSCLSCNGSDDSPRVAEEGRSRYSSVNNARDQAGNSGERQSCNEGQRLFNDDSIHDVFLGAGQYASMAIPEGIFGLGFKRSRSMDGSFIGFGHSGMGGSTGFVDIKNRFAMAVTLNKMSMGTVTRNIIQLVCSELGIPVSMEHMTEAVGESSIERPMIN